MIFAILPVTNRFPQVPCRFPQVPNHFPPVPKPSISEYVYCFF